MTSGCIVCAQRGDSQNCDCLVWDPQRTGTLLVCRAPRHLTRRSHVEQKFVVGSQRCSGSFWCCEGRTQERQRRRGRNHQHIPKMSGDTSSTFVDGNPHSGSSAANLGPVGHLGLLSQSIPTAGFTSCTLSFWISSSSRPAEFEVWWNQSRLTQIVNVPDLAYTQMSYRFLVPGGS